ncbi:MAG: polysaccharide deacetylase family protein, partial [Eubacteriales bacterium]|nr:polysaccharide deacetylase family protein [Eubacteriales bacterium]
MKKIGRKISIGALCLLLCAALLLLNGCAILYGEQQPEATPTAAETTPVLLHASVTPAPTLENEPAVVYTNVLTEKRIVSLVLEGYTDADTMKSIAAKLKEARIPAVFFISGIVADEHPDVVRLIANQNFTIGNYGLSASKNMQDNDIPTNIHLFQRGQELLLETTGEEPTLFRCNGSEYTREVLQAAAYVGLKAGVKPNLFLNHTSFQTYDDAKSYVKNKLARGSIVTIKLGQALDADEYLQTTYVMSNRAVDPPPMLSDKMEDIIAETYVNIINVVDWLMQAMEDENMTFVTPEELQAQRITMFDSPAELS